MRRKPGAAGAGRRLLAAVRMASLPLLALALLAGSFSPETRSRIEELRHEVHSDRTDLESRRELAGLLARSDDVEERREAVELISQGLLIDQNDVDLWIRLARLQNRRGFQREARLAYARALELEPDNPRLWSELAAHELSRFQHYQRGDLFEKAVANNDRSLELDPDDADAVARAARLAAMQGDRAGLDSLCARWEEISPRDPWPHLLRGMLLTEVGAWKRARSAFDAGMKRLSPDARRAFLELSAVDPLAEEERLAAPDSLRFWEDFWRWRDPTPADDDNPRLLEHYRRLVQAELYFGREGEHVAGWEHAPGRAVISYGLPRNWVYLHNVIRGTDFRVTSSYAVPAITVRYGEDGHPLHFTFVDYMLNGHFYQPISGFPSGADFLRAEMPSLYVPPFKAPELDQEIELWRFRNPAGGGRIEVAAALDPDTWPAGLLSDPDRLASQMTLYDEHWEPLDEAVASWAQFTTDDLGRLVGVFTLDAVADSAIVGIETRDRLDAGRAAGYATLPPDSTGEGPSLSDIAFLTRVGFDGTGGRYARAYGSALPNPGHRYEPGAPLGLAFEAYGLATDEEGRYRARIRITVGRISNGNWLKVLLRMGGGEPEAELSFETSEPGSTLEQLLAVDLPRLRSGEYTLRVVVEDLVGGGRTQASEPFTVLKRSRSR